MVGRYNTTINSIVQTNPKTNNLNSLLFFLASLDDEIIRPNNTVLQQLKITKNVSEFGKGLVKNQKCNFFVNRYTRTPRSTRLWKVNKLFFVLILVVRFRYGNSFTVKLVTEESPGLSRTCAKEKTTFITQ